MTPPKDLFFRSLAILSLGLGAHAQDWIVDLNSPDSNPLETAVLPNGDLALLTEELNSPVAGVRRLALFDGASKPAGSVVLQSPSGSDIQADRMIARADGTLLLTGGYYPHAWVGVLDPGAMSMVWESTTVLAPNKIRRMTAIDENAGTLVAGGRVETGSGVVTGYVVRLDGSGNVLWQRLLGPSDEYSSVSDLAVAADGSTLATVLIDPGSGPDTCHLVRLDPFGNLEFSKQVTAPGGAVTYLERLSDGHFALARGANATFDPWIAKIDAQGSIQWEFRYPSVKGQGMTRRHDGGVYLELLGSAPGILSIDSAGQPQWLKYINTSLPIPDRPRTSLHPDGSLLVGWPAPLASSTNYLSRFSASGSTGPACAGEVTYFPTSAQPASHPMTPSSIPVVPLVEGGFAGLSTALQPAPHFGLPYCGNPITSPPTYCESSPNSAGPGAKISGSGSTSLFQNNLTLSTSGLPNQKPCIYFYGSSPKAIPFGNGTLCVGGTTRRLSPRFSDSSGLLQQDFDASVSPITVGSTWYLQCWYRDPASGGSGFNLSNGLTTTWSP